GLRPALAIEAENITGSRMIDGCFTAVQQAIGVAKGKHAAAEFIAAFVIESKTNGFITSLINKHGVTGRLAIGSS
ncbi:MAG: ABC transporter substrate-binding protein, partial [Alphaproteobacteria bacterium]